jgi:hypothetical protein
MKTAIPLLLIATIATETIEVSLELKATQPHVEPETKIPDATRLTQPTTTGGDASEEAPGTFRGRILHKLTLRAGIKGRGKNGKDKRFFAMLDALVDTAHAVVNQYPNMTLAQRYTHYICFKSHVELTRVRAGFDYSFALPLIARILDVQA